MVKKDKRYNAELASIFHQMASCYRYLGPENRFRVMAYEGAVRTISNLADDISLYAKNVESLDALKGIGEGIAEKIMEYIRTGKIHTWEALKREVPLGLIELLDVNGFGPSTIKTLHEKLKINTRDELIDAIEKGKIEKLKGFGARKVENMKRGLKLFKESHARMLLWEALQLGNELSAMVKGIPGVAKTGVAGSLRRKKETIGDIDIIASAAWRDRKKIVQQFTSFPEVLRVLASGASRAAILLKQPKVQVDLRLVEDHEYGAALLYFTGSKEHNIRLRTWAKSRGWKLNEYGVFDIKSERKVAGKDEKEIYRLFGMQFIEPEIREDKGELELALQHKLPELINEKDIRGDLQMHSTWSDGAASIQTIADFVTKHFPHYEYIVITDHSPGERIAHGLDVASFKKQFREIDAVNNKMGKPFVKKGVEVDILTSGRPDLPDKLLTQFDWVTASVHSGFGKNNTKRLIKACEHPSVHCIGHPGGRILGKREGYTVEWDELFAAAVKTNTALEINAQPNRLDLTAELVRKAIEKGVMITISTDAHALVQFDYMKLGVSVARRGWCAGKNILNTLTWKEIEKWKNRTYAKK